MEDKLEILVADLQPKENEWVVCKYKYPLSQQDQKDIADYLKSKFGERAMVIPDSCAELKKYHKEQLIKAFENILEWLKSDE